MDFTTAAVCDGKHDWSVGQKPYPKPLLDKKKYAYHNFANK